MSADPNITSSTKRKAESQDSPTHQEKKARIDEEELAKEASALIQYLEQLPKNQPKNGLAFVADLILKGEPYHATAMNLLEIPITKPNGTLDQSTDFETLALITDLANGSRARLAELYRSLPKDDVPKDSFHGEGLFYSHNETLLYAIQDNVLSDAKRRSSLNSMRAEHPVNIGRPLHTTGPPISLYHPVFAKFTALIEDPSFSPSTEDETAAFQLIFLAAEVHASETAYLRYMWPGLNRLLGHRAITRSPWDYPCKPEGVLFHKVDAGTAPFLVVHTKSEIGTAGLDPTDQAAFSFHNLWALSPLTEMLGLANFPDPFGRARYIAKILAAFRNCIEELETFYNDLVPAEVPRMARLSPTFRQYGGDNKVTLTYTSGNILNDRTGRAMFFAKAKQPGDEEVALVLVRFSARYCREAHALLAEKDLAPKIFHYEELDNGWVVVVMDCIDGQDLETARQWTVPSRTLKDVEEALRVLHEENLVFGDLRKPNILMCDRDAPGGGTEKGGMLVDFDWAGKHGEQRYPLSLNTDFKWAEGVEPGGIMKKEHDVAMLKMLRPARAW
ncbi:hypothetical protein FRC01_002861 [Tulasnella sp. 417]|nr:hypothetical protein FRC01_002861 [Tulasnella sp. 417]